MSYSLPSSFGCWECQLLPCLTSRFLTCMSTLTPDHEVPFISTQYSIAAVLTHLSATAWGGFQICDTRTFHRDFKRLTTDGPCHVNLLPSYWLSRSYAEIPSFAFNAAALLLSCFLSLKLIKVTKLRSSPTTQLMLDCFVGVRVANF